MSDNIMLHKVQGVSEIPEQFLGLDCTGSDGDPNRVLTTVGVSTAKGSITVFSDGQFLRETTDYTLSGNDITFLINLWDANKIDVRYLQ